MPRKPPAKPVKAPEPPPKIKSRATVEDSLRRNRAAAMEIVSKTGHAALAKKLELARRTIEQRLKRVQVPGDAFTPTAMRLTLHQLEAVLAQLKAGIKDATLDTATKAAEASYENTVSFMVRAERQYHGIADIGPRIREAAKFDPIVEGVNASILRRIGSDADYRGKKVQQGVLDRYGIAVIGKFENVLQQAVLTGQDWASVRESLTAQSTWLQDSPAYWSERILRNETSRAYNAVAVETIQKTQKEVFTDAVKILVAHFDDRTNWDSYQVHGQIRRPGELFEDGHGNKYMEGPGRPNDREEAVPWRESWPIEPYLLPRSDEEVKAVYDRQMKRKNGKIPPGPPPRPPMWPADWKGRKAIEE